MATETRLVVEKRVERGTAAARKLRRRGVVPGNVYGHEQGAVAISVSEDALRQVINAGTRVLDIELGGRTEKTMFREVQWDTFGRELQHFDLIRIDAEQRVTVEVPLELRGTAPGTLAGGVLEQALRTFTVECLAVEIPESIVVRVGHLDVGDAIHVREIELPDGAVVQNPADATVVHVVKPVDEEEEAEEESMAAPAEPEVIGRKTDDDADNE